MKFNIGKFYARKIVMPLQHALRPNSFNDHFTPRPTILLEAALLCACAVLISPYMHMQVSRIKSDF